MYFSLYDAPRFTSVVVHSGDERYTFVTNLDADGDAFDVLKLFIDFLCLDPLNNDY